MPMYKTRSIVTNLIMTNNDNLKVTRYGFDYCEPNAEAMKRTMIIQRRRRTEVNYMIQQARENNKEFQTDWKSKKLIKKL